MCASNACWLQVFKDDSSIESSSHSLRSMDSLGMSEASIKRLTSMAGSGGGGGGGGGAPNAGAAKRAGDEVAAAADIVGSFDSRELTALFTSSSQLNSEVWLRCWFVAAWLSDRIVNFYVVAGSNQSGTIM